MAKRYPRDVKSSAIVAQLVAEIKSEALRGALPNMRLLCKQVEYARREPGRAVPKGAAKRENISIPEDLKEIMEPIFRTIASVHRGSSFVC